MDVAAFPPDLRPLIGAARDLARRFLASAPDPVALHGDLHHDNILKGPQGWRAIDAKGLAGDPAFETANSFRNPEDCQALARDPARIGRLADIFARRLDLPRARLLGWALVQAAVSACWMLEDGGWPADDLALLQVLSAASAPG